VGSPLAAALTFRGVARWWLGRPGWRPDFDDAVAMARRSDPATLALVLTWTFGYSIQYGVLRADDSAVRAIEEAVQNAAGTSNDVALSIVKYALGGALLSRHAAADRHRGLELMVQVRDMWRESGPFAVPVAELWAARERARRGEPDAAITVMRKVVNDLYQAGRPFFGVWGAGVLAEALLKRGTEGDLAESQEAIDRLANLRPDEDWAGRDIWLLRLRALLAQARDDEATYRGYRDRYRAMAIELGFEGHMEWAEAMP
jgi:hypothetical protein